MACISRKIQVTKEKDFDENSSVLYLTNGYGDEESVSNKRGTNKNKKTIPEEVRLRVNDRERYRMHQLNNAMESLKHVLPYCRSVGKMSKLSTLQLARNYIVSLQKTQNELVLLKEKLMAEQLKNQVKKTSVNVLHGRDQPRMYPDFAVYMDKHPEFNRNIDQHFTPKARVCDIINTNNVQTVKSVPATSCDNNTRKTPSENYIPSDISNSRTKCNATLSKRPPLRNITCIGYQHKEIAIATRQIATKNSHKFSIENLLS